MAISDDKLKQFFSKQKIGNFSALKQAPNIRPIKRKDVTEQSSPIGKPIDIADQDRPYSIDNHASHDSPQIIHIEPKKVVGRKRRPWILDEEEETRDKLETNIGQTGDKPKTILRQTRDKLETNVGQTRDKLKTELRTQLKTEISENLRQTRDKLETNKIFAKMSGLQKNILLFIYEECLSVLDSETAPLSIEYVSNACNSTIPSVRKTIQRMIINKILIRSDFKEGRGGWTKYKLPKDIYQEINNLKSNNKLETNLRQSRDKLETELRTQLRTNASSSSSYLDNKKTTTNELSEEWNFDIHPYAKFGFTNVQLKQIASLSVISASEVEQSLVAFNYDLENNSLPPIKTTKINFLMGLFRKGLSYASQSYLNELEAEIAENNRRLETTRKNLLEVEFLAWERSLTQEEKENLRKKLSTSLTVLYNTYGFTHSEIRKWMFNYFMENGHKYSVTD